MRIEYRFDSARIDFYRKQIQSTVVDCYDS